MSRRQGSIPLGKMALWSVSPLSLSSPNPTVLGLHSQNVQEVNEQELFFFFARGDKFWGFMSNYMQMMLVYRDTLFQYAESVRNYQRFDQGKIVNLSRDIFLKIQSSTKWQYNCDKKISIFSSCLCSGLACRTTVLFSFNWAQIKGTGLWLSIQLVPKEKQKSCNSISILFLIKSERNIVSYKVMVYCLTYVNKQIF